MTLAIIDDELTNRLLIKNMLRTIAPGERVVVEEGLIEHAIAALNKLKPDVVFLDIELRNGTGFDILKRLDYHPEIIFTTAYSQYAIDAIKVQAFDYLLKPIDEKELAESLKRCLEKITEKSAKQQRQPGIGNFFLIATNEGRVSLNYQDILYFESSGSYTYCATRTKKIIFSRNIGEVEKDLAPDNPFFRCHHGYLVNLNHVSRVEIKRNGLIYLNNNLVIPLAQRKIKEFKKLATGKI